MVCCNKHDKIYYEDTQWSITFHKRELQCLKYHYLVVCASYPKCTILNTFTSLEEMQTIIKYLHLHYFNYCIQLGLLVTPHFQPVL